MDVPPERLVSWIVTFTQRHGVGPVSGDASGVAVTFAAPDGTAAVCYPPFPPLRWAGTGDEGDPAAVAIFGPHRLDDLVLGGDKRSIAGIRGDPRLAPYLALATDRFLTVPDPRLAVLKEIPRSFLSIRIRLTEPEPDSPG